MRDQITKIRELLDEIEANGVPETAAGESDSLPAAEMAVVVQEIVDDLQPLLSPYEAAFYWYAFRHSIAKDSNPYLRLSTRVLQRAVIRSSYSRASENAISLDKVRETLDALETIGAIRKEGEPNREGTPYRVLIPDEIEACRKLRAERTAKEPRTEVESKDVDFYNVRENRIKVYERDGYKCRYCGKQLTRFTCTLDHVTPVDAGGTNSFDNLVTACLECNSRKHRRPLGDFLAEQ
ncbi:MAG TPA: HNH endonuclease signature motif containing protein [Candidatus Acidoferrales bacterium]|nr:HNH endonuclease signature motif containing protein [Candidatus Acidoferrales bacterium]